MIFWTSDQHFEHANVIGFCLRPFADTDAMTEELIARYNAKVKPTDTCYFLGDFSFAKADKTLNILKRLNGKKILVRGNHDQVIKKSREVFEAFDDVLGDLCEVKIEGVNIVMSHYPLLTWNRARYGSWMLHGHSHGTIPFDGTCRRYDVGVDCNNYEPISFAELKEKMDKVEPNEPQNYPAVKQ